MRQYLFDLEIAAEKQKVIFPKYFLDLKYPTVDIIKSRY